MKRDDQTIRSFVLPKELDNQLKAFARYNSLSVSEALRNSIEAVLHFDKEQNNE